MRKTITCKPVDEIELINGGESILLRFDVQSVIALQELAQEKNLDMETLFKIDHSELTSMIIYCSAKYCNANITEEKAREYASMLSFTDMIDVIETYSKSIGDAEGIDKDEIVKKILAQFENKKH